MSMEKEIKDAIAVVRSMLDAMEERLAAGDVDLPQARQILVRMVGSLMSEFRPAPSAGRRPRGLGYDLDEAMIMASVDEYGGSIEKAARAHWQGQDEDMVEAKIRRLYRHKKEIEDTGEGRT